VKEYSPRKILLASDGSGDAAFAATAAVDLSKRTRAELHLVHARRALPRDAYPTLVPERYQAPYEHGARKILEEQVGRIEQAGGGTVAEAYLVLGRPADAILDLGERIGADLIVVGSRGLGASEAPLGGKRLRERRPSCQASGSGSARWGWAVVARSGSNWRRSLRRCS
jgi:nucleotide-binding universal stress UspA family protein